MKRKEDKGHQGHKAVKRQFGQCDASPLKKQVGCSGREQKEEVWGGSDSVYLNCIWERFLLRADESFFWSTNIMFYHWWYNIYITHKRQLSPFVSSTVEHWVKMYSLHQGAKGMGSMESLPWLLECSISNKSNKRRLFIGVFCVCWLLLLSSKNSPSSRIWRERKGKNQQRKRRYLHRGYLTPDLPNISLKRRVFYFCSSIQQLSQSLYSLYHYSLDISNLFTWQHCHNFQTQLWICMIHTFPWNSSSPEKLKR